MQALTETKQRLHENDKELHLVRIKRQALVVTLTRLQEKDREAKAEAEGPKSILNF